MSKLPAFQFYPGDWRKDPNLSRCSKAAKGVWIDAMCLMFECEDRGVFATGGSPWTREEIAAAIGGDMTENLACLDELLRKGVAVLTKLGAISNRRMVKDEERRADQRCRQNKFRNSHKSNENSDALVTHDVTPMSHRSSSSTSTTKQNLKATPKAAPSTFALPDWVPKDAWTGFEEVRKKIRAPLTDRARLTIIGDLEKLRAEGHDPGTVLDQSTSRGWRGVFAVKLENGRHAARSPSSQVGYHEPEEVERMAQLIDSRYGAFGNPDPAEMVEKAKSDNVFSDSTVTPGEVLALLENWQNFRNRQRKVQA